MFLSQSRAHSMLHSILGFVLLMVTEAIVGAVLGGIHNKLQGNDVPTSVEHGLYLGIATAVMSWLTNFTALV